MRVQSLEQARAALIGGASHLESVPYAACHLGVNYFKEFLQQLRTEFPGNNFTFTLCCGGDPAIAHDALRMGFKSITCDASPAMIEKLKSIADGYGATVKFSYEGL